MKDITLYGSIIQYIKDGIMSGEFAPGQQIPTEMELVKKFNASRPTVSKALSELSIQELIIRIPGKGSFVSGSAHMEKQRNSARIVSLITPFEAGVPNRSDEIEIIRGVESYLKEQGYFLTLQFSEQNSKLEKQLIKKCRDEAINGIILYPVADTDNDLLINELYFNDYPLVFLEKTTIGVPITCVYSDNVKGGYEATKHLVDSGYEDIYFVSSHKIKKVTSILDRYLGYCKALKEHGKSFSEQFVIEDFATNHNIESTLTNYKDNPDIFKRIISNIHNLSNGKSCGIFADDDFVANSLLKAAADLNLKLPDEIGIVGYGDIDIYPGTLTTIRQNYYEIGRISAKTIVDKINFGITQKDTLVDVELVVRESTAGNQSRAS